VWDGLVVEIETALRLDRYAPLRHGQNDLLGRSRGNLVHRRVERGWRITGSIVRGEIRARSNELSRGCFEKGTSAACCGEGVCG
jgi:hypothetical protein